MKGIYQSLDDYAQHHIETGNFLRAVLENDLFTALGRADVVNRHRLFDICDYIYNELPSSCWGSKQQVEKWLRRKNK